jgi:Tfp pilus assembly protein PilN
VIRINLLGVERQKTKKAIVFDVAQRITLACSLIVVLAALLIGWWYWSINEESTRVDAEIVAATQEAARLQSLLAEVREFEGRRAQLQLLDHVSRSLPDMLWLTEVVQDGNALTISGRSMTLISLSDFVGNLGRSPLLTKPIEIVQSQVESVSPKGGQAGQPVEVITFEVKAQIAVPEGAAGGPGAAAAGAAAPAAGHAVATH